MIKVCYYLFIPLLLLTVDAHGGIVFHDDVTVKGRPFMLKAETRGRFFPKRGQIVEFFVNNRSIGRNLSGGDGIALKEFIPKKRGLYRITVESKGEKDEGHILSLNQGEGIVFIDIEGSLFEGLFSMNPREGSKKAVDDISKRFPIVYLKTGILDRELLEEWLEKNNFQKAPILQWEEGEVFNETMEKGLMIKAIIGAPAVIESIEGNKFKAFSFEDVEGVEWVKDWKEIEEKLH